MPELDPILAHLEVLFQKVKHAVTTGEPEPSERLGRNPKGDEVKWFDLAADRAVCAYLAERFPHPVKLLSEEGGPRQFGAGAPDFTVILDPVDGSENFSRGLAPAGMAVALIPAHLPITVENVQFALVGNLFTGDFWLAGRGQGVFSSTGRPLQTSAVPNLREALISCDLNHSIVDPILGQILGQARGVRAMGSAALELTMVAAGVFDAHLDLRDQLTPENFLAAALLIREAGGVITGSTGEPLPPVESLTESYSLVAAATPQLHLSLIELLRNET